MSRMSAKAQTGPMPHDPFLHPFSIKKAFGKRWKIQMEESWRYEKPENKIGYEGWYEQVPTACGGFIGLFQDKPMVVLQFYTPKQRLTSRKLAAQFKDTPGVRLDDGFDGYETVLYFPPELFEQVAVAVAARKRRVLSPEHKEKLAIASKATRFFPHFHGSNSLHKSQDERECGIEG
ncbi:MAG: hypothetical protein FJ134_07905 [Deltaproteobacteria bacterium]|nr:hypothetical protein [Deltaproteobacteria bacterium]